MVNPYTEFTLGNGDRLRVFKPEVEDEELVWHRDEENRKVLVMESGGWKLQMDNEEPVTLVKDRTYDIPKMVYHRIIKGEYELVLRIKKV